jgi:RNA-binding protein 5/10
MSSLSLGGVEDTWVRYWDEAATAAVLEFEVEAAIQTSAPVKEKKERKKVKGTCHAFYSAYYIFNDHHSKRH